MTLEKTAAWRFAGGAMIALGAYLAASGVWAAPEMPPKPMRDPLRPLNVAVFTLNEQVLDPYLLKPVVRIHNKTVPKPARVSIRHFLFNLTEPVTIENALLQGNFPQAARSTGRFGINTTIGVLGLMDPASSFGLDPHKEDFGQTLGVYGLGQGPYIVLPVLGASSARDLTGRIVDGIIDPFSLINFQNDTLVSVGKKGLEELEERAHEVKSDLRTGAYTHMTPREHYALDRSEFQIEQIAEVRNQAPPTVLAANAAVRPFQRSPFDKREIFVTGDADLAPVQTALDAMGLRVSALDRREDRIAVTVAPDGGARPLPCADIWTKLPAQALGDAHQVTVTTDGRAGPSYSCTKLL